MKADRLVCGDHVLTMEDGVPPIGDGAVAVLGERIVEVGPRQAMREKYPRAEILGGPRKAVMPGLVNAHTHAAMSLLRGYADDLPLKRWLEERIWPAENAWMGPEFVRAASELACLEMLKAGVTAFCDMYFFQDVTAEVVTRIGMRASLGAGVIDFPTKTTAGPEDCIEKARAFIARWKGDARIAPSVAAHTPYTCGRRTLEMVRDLSEAEGVPVQIHLSETQLEVANIVSATGKLPALYLEEIGFLSGRLVASHCVWLTDEEIALLAGRGVKVAHCPESNLKLASGFAPVVKMLKAGVKVALGTDGPASNNDLSVLGELQSAAKLHKALSGDATALDAGTSLMMATAWGAEAIGFPDAGRLVPGALADIVVLDLDKPHLTPLYDIRSQIVYAAQPSDVDTVLVAGRVVVAGGVLTTDDEERILAEARLWGARLWGAGAK